MATDYDAPRKVEEETESIQALQERVPDKLSGAVDSEDAVYWRLFVPRLPRSLTIRTGLSVVKPSVAASKCWWV